MSGEVRWLSPEQRLAREKASLEARIASVTGAGRASFVAECEAVANPAKGVDVPVAIAVLGQTPGLVTPKAEPAAKAEPVAEEEPPAALGEDDETPWYMVGDDEGYSAEYGEPELDDAA
jgi:hypothetical protein